MPLGARIERGEHSAIAHGISPPKISQKKMK
jgi:hypothetical protein